MNLDQAFSLAAKYGISSEGTRSPEAFVSSVEATYDADVKDRVIREGRKREARRLYLRETKHGHDFNYPSMKCRHCGITVREYHSSREQDVCSGLSHNETGSVSK